MATIREVAKLAGVSIGTVSKVLNGTDERVDPASKERILASVRALRYKPPPFEKNQDSAITNNLGLIVPDLTGHPLVRHGYAHLLLDGILERSAFRGWSVTIFAATMWDDVGNAVRRKYDGRCDGLIVVAPQPSHDIVPSLHRRGVPVVQVGTTAWLEDVSSIDIDNVEAGRVVAQHFWDLGHRKLGFLGLAKDQVSSLERFEGFRSVGGDKTVHLTQTRERQMPGLVQDFIDLGPDRPTAIMGWHDGIAVAFIKELEARGFEVPRDVSVAGVDNATDAVDLGIELTSIINPLHEIGTRAAAMAIDRVLDPLMASEIVKLPAVLIPRASSRRLSE